MSEEEKKTKAPIYKKWWFWVVIVFVFIVICATGSSKSNEEVNNNALSEIMSKDYTEDSEEYSIADTIYGRVKGESSLYDDVTIDSITVNENLGTPEVSDDYIVLVNLTWNRKNGEDLTKQMIRMMCDDTAAHISEQNPHVQEIALFWTIPYQKEGTVSAKCAYERKNDKMHLSDKMGLVGD